MLRRNIDVTVGLVNGAIGIGLSLDTAIIDLSSDVFGDVSNPCINEINRLRSKFWNYLPQIKKSKGKKRMIQVTGIIDDGEPCSKNAKVFTSNPKKDDVIFTYEEPPNPDIVRRRQWDYVYYPSKEEFQRRWYEILNLKFVTAARILPGSPTTPLSDERVPNSTLDIPVMGTVYFMPFHISLLGQFLSIANYIKQLLVICQTLKNCLIVH
uniref:Uncharacterized protein n=1 Tax=Amphimedon queenslandica TaxID=400682 RepID=A0A1X7TYE9_AMPQE